MSKDTKQYIITLIATMAACFLIFHFVIGIAVVHGASMNPTYTEGNFVFFHRTHYVNAGDVAIIECDSLNEYIIKRVIGKSGDTIEIKDGITYINGNPLDEESIIVKTDDQMDPVTVPEGMIFVMGDNRRNSVDSRYSIVGMLPTSKVLGTAIG